MRSAGWFEGHARSGLEAAAEALFPENDYGVPDFRETELVARTLAYLHALPSRGRSQLLLLFVAIELGSPLFTLRLRRFSRLSPLQREQAARALRRSVFAPFRLLGDALKATLTLVYLAHPAPLAFIADPARDARSRPAARFGAQP